MSQAGGCWVIFSIYSKYLNVNLALINLIQQVSYKDSPVFHLYFAHLLSLLETSMSFMKHSMPSGRSEELALISFFNFSHS